MAACEGWPILEGWPISKYASRSPWSVKGFAQYFSHLKHKRKHHDVSHVCHSAWAHHHHHHHQSSSSSSSNEDQGGKIETADEGHRVLASEERICYVYNMSFTLFLTLLAWSIVRHWVEGTCLHDASRLTRNAQLRPTSSPRRPVKSSKDSNASRLSRLHHEQIRCNVYNDSLIY